MGKKHSKQKEDSPIDPDLSVNQPPEEEPEERVNDNVVFDPDQIHVAQEVTVPDDVVVSYEHTDYVFFDIAIGNSFIGKIVFGLFGNTVPNTARNFKLLCSGENRNNDCYKGSTIHRIVKGFMVQGGDFTNGDGTGGRSIWGAKFPDENFYLSHTKPYILSMANQGPNSNGSGFFILMREAPNLDGKYVVFGEVVQGFGVVDVIDDTPCLDKTEFGRPLRDISIVDCGIYQGDLEN
eukprot:TRINITY_DN9968_c0_g1_i1.p1 TRINITY_DN9968_c0_g1~~TRINITY_DN9968_c0_g1_i1.p1  ORF type:complete len:236 (-),score=52.47 TRINITY_DN9968_c0_g1_i1:65-772(-)